MRQPGPRRYRYPPKALLQRLDRAAADLNPLLMIIMIGLFILNLVVVAALVPRLRLTRVAGDCLTAAKGPAAAPVSTSNPSMYPH